MADISYGYIYVPSLWNLWYFCEHDRVHDIEFLDISALMADTADIIFAALSGSGAYMYLMRTNLS